MRLVTASFALSMLLLEGGTALAGPEWGSPNWTGLYFGAAAGINQSNVDWQENSGTGFSPFAHLGSVNGEARFFTGYDYQVAPRVVAGLEFGAELMNTSAI